MSLFVSTPPPWLRTPERSHFSESDLRSLDALFSAILPGDHRRQIPGAVECGASRFVSQLLAMGPDVYAEIPAWRTLYANALQALESYSRAKYQQTLNGLAAEELALVIQGLEAGTLAGLPPSLDQKLVFTTLRRHCIQGCFADPRWGGNQERRMWRAIGYLQPPEDLYDE